MISFPKKSLRTVLEKLSFSTAVQRHEGQFGSHRRFSDENISESFFVCPFKNIYAFFHPNYMQACFHL